MPKEGSWTPGSALGHRQGSLAGPAGHIASPRCRGTQSTLGSGLVLAGELKYSRRARTRIQPSMFCGGGQHQDPALGRADHPEGLWPASPSPSGHPKSRDVGKEPRGSAFTQLLGPCQPRLWGKAWSRGTRAHPPDAGRLPKHEDFQSPLKSHLELSPGIKPGLSLVRFSISAPACFSKKFFKGSGRSF